MTEVDLWRKARETIETLLVDLHPLKAEVAGRRLQPDRPRLVGRHEGLLDECEDTVCLDATDLLIELDDRLGALPRSARCRVCGAEHGYDR